MFPLLDIQINFPSHCDKSERSKLETRDALYNWLYITKPLCYGLVIHVLSFKVWDSGSPCI